MKNGGPSCPNPTRLRECRKIIAHYGASDLLPYEKETEGNSNAFDDTMDALEWLATFLENRSLYHRKQALKVKILKEKANELGITEEVDKLAADAIFNHVANQSPDDTE